jgi:hypothetical protein
MFTAIMMALCVGFSSCSDDDEENGDDSIVNVWTFVNMTADIQNPTYPDAAEVEDALVSELLELRAMLGLASIFWQGATLEIKSDRTFVFNLVGQSQTGSYSINGDRLSVTFDNNGFMNEEDLMTEEEFDQLLHSNVITITAQDGVLTITINLLDEEYAEGITPRQLGFTKCEIKMTFRRYVTK